MLAGHPLERRRDRLFSDVHAWQFVRRERDVVWVFASSDLVLKRAARVNPHPYPLPAYREREVVPTRFGIQATSNRTKNDRGPVTCVTRASDPCEGFYFALHCLMPL